MKNFLIYIILFFISPLIKGQDIKSEYLYLKRINDQETFLIKDNLANATIALDSILYSYPLSSTYSPLFIEELATSYFRLGEYETALFYYLLEESLFPEKSKQASRLESIRQCYELLAIDQEKISKINAINRLSPIYEDDNLLIAPLLLVKYLNTKKLDLTVTHYIQTIRQKNIFLPQELLLWEDLVRFRIPPRKRTSYFAGNFDNLSPVLRRKFYRKGTHYYLKIGNQEKAKNYHSACLKLSAGFFHKLCCKAIQLRLGRHE
jgi:hypothetical protein